MSWLDRIKNGMRITTGDGEQYNPDYLNASFQTEYHMSEYHWIDVGGSFVDRKKPLGRRYRIEIYFQGADNIETALKFANSADDSRAWIIEHPLYDRLTVQPTSLEFNNYDDKLGATMITGTVIATMGDAPFSNFLKTLADDIPELANQVAASAEVSLTEIPSSEDVNRMARNNTKSFKSGVKIITNAIDYSSYNNAFTTASNYINTATATPLFAMRSMIAVMQMPANFKANADNRLQALFTAFDTIRKDFLVIFTNASKQIFAIQQASCLSGVCVAAATPAVGDYKTKDQILDLITKISGRYAQLVSDLDTLQSVNAGTAGNYVADYQLLHDLNQLVNTTLGNLYTIALGAKVERIVTVEKDTNIILLAHRYLGFETGEGVIDQLMAWNNIGLNEILQIKKGRKITYYV